MKDSFALTSDLLLVWGKALLLATFSISLIQAMRDDKDLTECFERLAMAVICMTFYDVWAGGLDSLSTELVSKLKKASESEDLKAVVLNGLQKAAAAPYPNGDKGFNIPALVDQVWRTGVWGILEQIVEFLFLTVELLIECAQDVLWKLALVLFPLSCGVFPILPGIMTNLCLYLVELALWIPLLCIVRTSTAVVAKSYIDREGSLGVAIVGVEFVACILILSIPAVTHRLMSGAFSGDFDAGSSVQGFGKKLLFRKKLLKGVLK